MIIHIEKVENLQLKVDTIFLTAEGEKVLMQLLELKQQIEDAIALAEAKLEKKGLELNPDFKSIQADHVKVSYREHGPKYYIDEAQINVIPKELYSVDSKIIYKIETKLVDKWTEQHKAMPLGILEVERKKKLKFSLKDKPDKEDEPTKI